MCEIRLQATVLIPVTKHQLRSSRYHATDRSFHARSTQRYSVFATKVVRVWETPLADWARRSKGRSPLWSLPKKDHGSPIARISADTTFSENKSLFYKAASHWKVCTLIRSTGYRPLHSFRFAWLDESQPVSWDKQCLLFRIATRPSLSAVTDYANYFRSRQIEQYSACSDFRYVKAVITHLQANKLIDRTICTITARLSARAAAGNVRLLLSPDTSINRPHWEHYYKRGPKGKFRASRFMISMFFILPDESLEWRLLKCSLCSYPNFRKGPTSVFSESLKQHFLCARRFNLKAHLPKPPFPAVPHIPKTAAEG